MIKIGARGSDLSTAQVEIVRKLLKDSLDLESQFIPIKSHGDINTAVPIMKVQQEGAFTSTLEAALLQKDVDIAVHSFKDLPTTNPEELTIVAVLKRHDIHDTLVINKSNIEFTTDKDFIIKNGSRIGTGSARRQSQLLHYFPDIATVDIRGNVETRLKKLEKGQYDGIILASAVFQRITLHIPANCVKVELDIDRFPTAPAQGAICIQMRKDNSFYSQIAKLDNQESRFSVELERNILREIGGGCQLPLGVTVTMEKTHWKLILTLAPKDWRDFSSIPLTKIHLINIKNENLFTATKKLLPKSDTLLEPVLQHKEVILFGNSSTTAKYDSYISSYGAITTSIDVQDIFTTLSKDNCDSYSDVWLKADWVLITSKNAIQSINIFNKYYTKNNLKIASVGFSTTRLLQKFGYAVHFQAEKGTSESLFEGLEKIVSKDESLFYLSANNAKSTLKNSFLGAGYSFTQIEVYTSHQKNELPVLPKTTNFDYCVVFSPEYARIAIEAYSKNIGKKWVSFGPSTSEKLQELGITDYKQLNHPTVEDLVEVLR